MSLLSIPPLKHEGGMWCPICEQTSRPGEIVQHETWCSNAKREEATVNSAGKD